MRFDSYHPFINFIYFVASVLCIIFFHHPIFLAIGYVATFIWSVKLNGKKSLILNLCLIPVIAFYTWWFSFYNHFGVTILGYNFIDNQITLEAIVVGFVRGVMAAAVVMECTCIFKIVTADKIVYLLGKISPYLSLFLSIVLRFIPRIIDWAKKTNRARCGVGQGINQGNIFQRIWHLIKVVSITLTWTIEHLVESAASMKSRGYSLKGRKAFSIYRFDNRDRGILLALIACIAMILLANSAGETNILYEPMIVMEPVTGMSVLFYVVYAAFLLLPMILQVAGEWKFKRLQKMNKTMITVE